MRSLLRILSKIGYKLWVYTSTQGKLDAKLAPGFMLGSTYYYTYQNIFELPAVRLAAISSIISDIISGKNPRVVDEFISKVEDYVNGKVSTPDIVRAINAIKRANIPAVDKIYELVAAVYFSEKDGPFVYDPEKTVAHLKSYPPAYIVANVPLFRIFGHPDGLEYTHLQEYVERAIPNLEFLEQELGVSFKDLKDEFERWKRL